MTLFELNDNVLLSTNNTQLAIVLMLKAYNDYKHLATMFSQIFVKISFVLACMTILPTLMLIFLDLSLYGYRLTIYGSKAAAISKAKRNTRRNVLYHTNSYFNFNNYIKRQRQSFVQNDRKNSTDSLNSNDSILDLQEHAEQQQQLQQGKVFLRRDSDRNLHPRQSAYVTLNRGLPQSGSTSVNNGHPYREMLNQRKNVVFSVSN